MQQATLKEQSFPKPRSHNHRTTHPNNTNKTSQNAPFLISPSPSCASSFACLVVDVCLAVRCFSCFLLVIWQRPPQPSITLTCSPPSPHILSTRTLKATTYSEEFIRVLWHFYLLVLAYFFHLTPFYYDDLIFAYCACLDKHP
jgi:hypothetical protein